MLGKHFAMWRQISQTMFKLVYFTYSQTRSVNDSADVLCAFPKAVQTDQS